MAGVAEFQQNLLSDPKLRARFAEDPRAVIEEYGIRLPKEAELPDKIPPEELERGVSDITAALAEEGRTLKDVDFASTSEVTRFVENAIPLRTRDLSMMEYVHDEFATESIAGGENPGDTATIAVVGAVVAAVVAVPVAVYGVTDRMREAINPEIGISRISSRARGLVVHGPQGLRVEGASVEQVANLISRLGGQGIR